MRFCFNEFQYILCYGSTQFCEKKMKEFIEFQYILCYGSTHISSHSSRFIYISIHPMLRFNMGLFSLFILNSEFQYILCYGSTSVAMVQIVVQSIFQYILCYGSTSSGMLSGYNRNDFNTSYVTVQRTWRKFTRKKE